MVFLVALHPYALVTLRHGSCFQVFRDSGGAEALMVLFRSDPHRAGLLHAHLSLLIVLRAGALKLLSRQPDEENIRCLMEVLQSSK